MDDPKNNENVPKPKKKMNKALKITLIVLGVILAIALLCFGAFEIYLDHMLGLISYDTSDSDETWSGVNIDDPSYDVESDVSQNISEDFVDPETSNVPDISDDTSIPDVSFPEDNSDDTSEEHHHHHPDVSYPPLEPDDSILDNLFDDTSYSDEYDADVINILLIGDDTRSNSYGRSDTMILMSINKTKKKVVFTSFMRDIYVGISGYRNNRLNAAYAAGGPKLLMDTIKRNFKIQIDYYAAVNFESFKRAFDNIGGLDIVINNNNYDYFSAYFKKSVNGLTKEQAVDGTHKVHLDAKQALTYARCRSLSGSDFTRTLHQRDLIQQFVNHCMTLDISEIHNLLTEVLPWVRTNIPKDMLKMMVHNIPTYLSYSYEDMRVPCAGSFKLAMINGRSVLTIDFQKNIRYLYAKIYG